VFTILMAALALAPRALLDEVVASSPEVAQARAAVMAERARVPAASALPDPTLSLGMTNERFDAITLGQSEMSNVSIALSQPLPWPGKRDLRGQVASLDEKRADAALRRAVLDAEARANRAYVQLALARGQLELLADQEQLWMQAGRAARARYEAGQAPQSDLLRAQIERARLQQKKRALQADADTALAELNRLRARPFDEALPTPGLADAPEPQLPAESDAQADAQQRSPELQLAMLGAAQSQKRADLAHRERYPDFAVSAAVMPRGSLPAMWQVGVSVGLPFFSGLRAADGMHDRVESESKAADAVKQQLRLRTHERLLALAALADNNRRYRGELLVLSAATARSALAQYEAGRLPFSVVLDALTGYVADRTSFLESLAGALLVSVAQQQLSLDSAAAAPAPQAPTPSSAPARSMNGM